MSAAERDKWDKRYEAGAYAERPHATVLLVDWLPRLRRGDALDVACGAGRNALFLAAHGFRVTALDISAVGLERARRAADERHLAIDWRCVDLDEPPDSALPVGPFDTIVWVRYVHRTLLPHLIARLAPGGTLLVEQHLETAAEVAGPSAAHRLAPGELLDATSDLTVLHHREGLVVDPDGRTVALAQLVAAAPE